MLYEPDNFLVSNNCAKQSVLDILSQFRSSPDINKQHFLCLTSLCRKAIWNDWNDWLCLPVCLAVPSKEYNLQLTVEIDINNSPIYVIGDLMKKISSLVALVYVDLNLTQAIEHFKSFPSFSLTRNHFETHILPKINQFFPAARKASGRKQVSSLISGYLEGIHKFGLQRLWL